MVRACRRGVVGGGQQSSFRGLPYLLAGRGWEPAFKSPYSLTAYFEGRAKKLAFASPVAIRLPSTVSRGRILRGCLVRFSLRPLGQSGARKSEGQSAPGDNPRFGGRGEPVGTHHGRGCIVGVRGYVPNLERRCCYTVRGGDCANRPAANSPQYFRRVEPAAQVVCSTYVHAARSRSKTTVTPSSASAAPASSSSVLAMVGLVVTMARSGKSRQTQRSR